jgi:hypothetical protein
MLLFSNEEVHDRCRKPSSESSVTDDSQIDRMKLMKLKPKKMAPKLKRMCRPAITPFPEEKMELARTVAQEYRDMEDGHHERVRAFLGRAYSVYRSFQKDEGAYEELRQDPFWENSRQKPKDELKTSKHVLLFLMRAETRNARTRASTYAKILDGFARKKVRADQVPGRIKALRGVEAAYDHFLGEERGLQTAKGRRRAARGGNDDKIQGEVEMASSSENSRGAGIDNGRPTTSFDPERHLIVELEPDEREAILSAGTERGGRVTFQFKITVHRDAKGFVHVVGELEPTDLPPDFSSMELEEPLTQFDEELE